MVTVTGAVTVGGAVAVVEVEVVVDGIWDGQDGTGPPATPSADPQFKVAGGEGTIGTTQGWVTPLGGRHSLVVGSPGGLDEAPAVVWPSRCRLSRRRHHGLEPGQAVTLVQGGDARGGADQRVGIDLDGRAHDPDPDETAPPGSKYNDAPTEAEPQPDESTSAPPRSGVA